MCLLLSVCVCVCGYSTHCYVVYVWGVEYKCEDVSKVLITLASFVLWEKCGYLSVLNMMETRSWRACNAFMTCLKRVHDVLETRSCRAWNAFMTCLKRVHVVLETRSCRGNEKVRASCSCFLFRPNVTILRHNISTSLLHASP